MRWLRTTWGSRLFASWLIACLVASVFAAGVRGGGRPACTPYGAWLRAQLRVPVDRAMEEAIGAAASTEARTLEAFLSAFVAAYEARRPQASLATAFIEHDLSNDALVAYLESRFNGVGAEGVPVRGSYQSVLAPAGKASDRPEPGLLAAVQHVLPAQRAALGPMAASVQPGVRLLRILSAAQPLGP